MKKIKSCSTLRVKAHQLLNEEEREVFKYAIRNYRKNQSIDTLCEIISKISNDSNRGCLISLIADMLKEEQKSQFLHRCYSRLPGYNLSQNHLETSEFQVDNEMKSSKLSFRVATFVSKNRLNPSQSNYNLGKSTLSFDDCGTSFSPIDKTKRITDSLAKQNNLIFSESEELLKTIERCSRKERPMLSNLQDKGFWHLNNDSATDNDSLNSYSSLQEKEPPMNKAVQMNGKPKYNTGMKTSKTTTFNDHDDHKKKNHQDDKSKLMVCKLHFSSVNILKECQDLTENLSISAQSTVVSLLHLNSFDDIFVEYHLPLLSELSPAISSESQCYYRRPNQSKPVVHRSIRAHRDNEIGSNLNGIMHRSIEEERDVNDTVADQQCQTSFVQMCDSSTQTFLA